MPTTGDLIIIGIVMDSVPGNTFSAKIDSLSGMAPEALWSLCQTHGFLVQGDTRHSNLGPGWLSFSCCCSVVDCVFALALHDSRLVSRKQRVENLVEFGHTNGQLVSSVGVFLRPLAAFS